MPNLTFSATITTGAPSVAVAASKTTVVEGQYVSFSATPTNFGTSEAWKDVETRWTFDDPGSFEAIASDHPHGNDRNIAFGPNASHVFNAPGVYTVTVESRVFGYPLATNTIDITVQAATDVYSAADTIVIALDGDHTGAPASDHLVTSVGDAAAVYNSKSRYRLVFKGSETHTRNFSFFVRYKTEVMFDTFGPGKVILDVSETPQEALELRDHTGYFIARNIDFVGPFTAADPNSVSSIPPDGLKLWGDVNQEEVTFSGCSLSGFSNCVISQAGSLLDVCMFDCTITDWWDYGIFMQTSRETYCRGTSIKQHVDAPTGGGKTETTNPFFPNHGPFRLSRPFGTTLVSLCDYFSNNNWSNSTQHQPTNRNIFQEAASIVRFIIDRLRSEGDALQLNSNAVAADAPSGVFDHKVVETIVDRVHHVSTSAQTSLVVVNNGGGVIRNSVFVIGNRDSEFSSSTDRYYTVSMPSTTSGVGKEGRLFNIHSNTVVDRRNATRAPNPVQHVVETADVDRQILGDFDNNVIYDRDVSSPQGESANIDLTIAFSSSYKGERTYLTPGTLNTATANTDTGVIPYPTAGSPLIAAASSGRVSAWDFMGRLRPGNPGVAGTPAQGALEVA